MYDPYDDLVSMNNKKKMIHKIKSIPTVHDKIVPKSGKSRKITTFSNKLDEIKEENPIHVSPELKPTDSSRNNASVRSKSNSNRKTLNSKN